MPRFAFGTVLLSLLVVSGCSPAVEQCSVLVPRGPDGERARDVAVAETPAGTAGCEATLLEVPITVEAVRSGTLWKRGRVWVGTREVGEKGLRDAVIAERIGRGDMVRTTIRGAVKPQRQAQRAAQGAAPAPPGDTSMPAMPWRRGRALFDGPLTIDRVKQEGRGAVADTKAIADKFARYARERDIWSRFHDMGDHDASEILDVLRRNKGTQAPPGSAPVATPAPVVRPAPGQTVPPRPAPAATPPPAPAPPGSYRWPLDAGLVSSEYGPRRGRAHEGMDIAAATGEPIYAITDGKVIYSGNGLRGYGNVVIVKHPNDATSLYAHASQLTTKVGAVVRQSDVIALVGNTGRSTGPHLHFEIREGERAANPRARLPKSRF